MTPRDELRAAVAKLRCEHHHPCQPPEGSVWRPGDCSKCGTPFGASHVSPLLAEDFATLLDQAADEVDMCERMNSRDPDNDGKTRVMVRPIVGPALALARLICAGASRVGANSGEGEA